MDGLLKRTRALLDKPVGDTIDHTFGTYDYQGAGVYFDSSVPAPEVYAPSSDLAKAYTPQRDLDFKHLMKKHGPNKEPRYDERDRDIILGGLRSATEAGDGGGLPEAYDINHDDTLARAKALLSAVPALTEAEQYKNDLNKQVMGRKYDNAVFAGTVGRHFDTPVDYANEDWAQDPALQRAKALLETMPLVQKDIRDSLAAIGGYGSGGE